MDGMITDLSCGGCAASSAPPEGVPRTSAWGQSVSIECDQLCPQKSCPAIVACICSNVPQEQSVRIGLRFQECSLVMQESLEAFVEEASSLGQTC